MYKYLTLASAFLMSGCMVSYGAYYQPQVLNVSPQEIALKTTIEKTQFDKCAQAVGAEVISNPEYFSMENTSYVTRLRSWLCKPPTHQLYVDIEYPGVWRFYQSATNDRAEAVGMTLISRDPIDCKSTGCSFSETVGIKLSEADLKRGAKQGLKYQLSAKSGDKTVIEVPANVVEGYLSGLALAK